MKTKLVLTLTNKKRISRVRNTRAIVFKNILKTARTQFFDFEEWLKDEPRIPFAECPTNIIKRIKIYGEGCPIPSTW